MGKFKRKYNSKARQCGKIIVHDVSGEKKVKLDESLFDNSHGYDESNALILPSTKRATKKEKIAPPAAKKLSKKRRRHLECVLQRREKKAKRGKLLDQLQQVQADEKEVRLLTTTADMQTQRQKRKSLIKFEHPDHSIVNTVKGSKKANICVNEDKPDEGSDNSVNTSDVTTEDEDDACGVEENRLSTTCEKNVHCDDVNACDEIPPDTSVTISIKEHRRVSISSEDQVAELNNKLDRTTDQHIDNIIEPIKPYKPSKYVKVLRSDCVQELRLALPILGEEQLIMETIADHPVTIICGETGSGKTTQVPQFLYEAGYALNDKMIAITEPRRVAAISMSQRVAYEMSLSSSEVSFQIRYDGNVTKNTRIKFLTDGVLLKEIQKDFLLSNYSAVIIDEAHERSVYTDILLGLLSRIVPLRDKKDKPLKLIVMSATLCVEHFTENSRLFNHKPPVINVESRQYPVTVHFNRRTPVDDYIQEAFRKICKIHRTLPEGGILVFVTGQQEVHTLCKKLRRQFAVYKRTKSHKLTQSDDDTETKHRIRKKERRRIKLPNINLDNYAIDPYGEIDEIAEVSHDESSGDEDDFMAELQDLDSDAEETIIQDPVHVLPMFSLLPTHKQALVFDGAPVGSRKIVVSTNVAETSLTIPDIKYVVDTGKVKEKRFDKVTGVTTFEITWVSKASANQRAGRAGRLGPGHCYRLYSSAVFNEFSEFASPEICRRPIDDLVLQMKDMRIHRVGNFPFPTPPAKDQIKAAEKLLVTLGALEIQPDDATPKITDVGHVMACFPISPRYSRMLSLGHQQGLLPYVVALVSVMSVQELFVEIEPAPETDTQKAEMRKRCQHIVKLKRLWAGQDEGKLLGDFMVLLKALGSAEYESGGESFCLQHGIRYKAMKEVRRLRLQLTNIVNSVLADINLCIDPKMTPPTNHQIKLLRQIILAGHTDHVARRIIDADVSHDPHMKYAYQCENLADPVFIHPSSVLYKQNNDFIVYQHVTETSRLYMKGICSIEPQWLPLLAPSQCTFSKPLDSPSPRYDPVKDSVVCYMDCTYGRCGLTVPTTEVSYPHGVDKYRWFARCLLEGQVFPSLAEYTPELLTRPSTMVKTWSKLQKRTETLLKALLSKNICNRAQLMRVWVENPKYLLKAYCEWVPLYLQDTVEANWPPST